MGQDESRPKQAEEQAAADIEDIMPVLEPPVLLSRLVASQGSIQKHLRPAARVLLLRSVHSWYETWTAKIGLVALLYNLGKGLPELSASPEANGFVYVLDNVHVAKKGKPGERRATLRILVFTKVRWLDIVHVRVRENSNGEGGAISCTCCVRYFSTGVFPLSIPGAPLLNSLFFWFPFGHNGLPSSKTLPDIRGALQSVVEVTGKSGLLV
ncbi:hypothetical protein T492DRAFT_1053722 [Pavlovales sp. CCMP2436]|nr:hypothetical protein T492DRAFT_1053722 [Pavlovales sp. CCMP2436]|mmetsp:Transcript_1562/g.3889  ORF Transcript_1562/g.3889 Transcript_1562/m.3889 type:complete len:211 (-) Transcript_1562:139-771(-)